MQGHEEKDEARIGKGYRVGCLADPPLTLYC